MVTPVEWLQLIVNGAGVVFTVFWLSGCIQNLRAMYRGSKNGVMELQAWEKITVGLLMLVLQVMWFFSALSSVLRVIDDIGSLRTVLAIRGCIGSVVLCAIVVYQRWVWARILFLDNQEQQEKRAKAG